MQCSLSIFHTPPAFPPIVITSNLWIFISTLTTQGSAIVLICPNKVTSLSLFQQPIHILKLPPACSATSRHFHLLPNNEDHMVTMFLSLDKANLNTINISTPDLHIWQHFDSIWTTADMQKFVDAPEVTIGQHYTQMIGHSESILPLEIKRDTEEEPSLTWKLQTHLWTYRVSTGIIFIVCIGIYCLKPSWFRPATIKPQPYSHVSWQHSMVDDNVEVTPIYRSRGKVEKSVRPHRNHDLCMELEVTRLESHCKQPVLSEWFWIIDC